VPALGSSTPAMLSSVVVLPAPLAPSSATTSPACTVRLTSRTTGVAPYPVVHGESGGPFLAYRIEAEGRTITYSADTEWTDTLVPAARNADLFICEAYYYDRVVKNHLDFKTLEKHLPEIAPKKLVLTHMSDDMLGRLDQLPHTTARDGLVIEF